MLHEEEEEADKINRGGNYYLCTSSSYSLSSSSCEVGIRNTKEQLLAMMPFPDSYEKLSFRLSLPSPASIACLPALCSRVTRSVEQQWQTFIKNKQFIEAAQMTRIVPAALWGLLKINFLCCGSSVPYGFSRGERN